MRVRYADADEIPAIGTIWMFDTASRTHRNFGTNYERLVEIKNRYDRSNLFRLNANVEPTV